MGNAHGGEAANPAKVEIPTSTSSASSVINEPNAVVKKWKCPFAPANMSSDNNESTLAASKCPVASKKNLTCDSTGNASKASTEDSTKCPVKSGYKNPNQYNVYSQIIDPKNNMPASPNQQKAPGQVVDLDSNRVSSNIPKAGTDSSTWLYPSPQMFWNAIVRKNKVDGAREQDMDIVVAIHNNMNEVTWRQVLAWEELRPVTDIDKVPKLLRFVGRPNDLSPKAYMKTLLGHPYPFDRHDWYIDRGGKEVRYVIDYYHDESAVSKDKKPKGLMDAHSMQSIQVDVRPALDSIEALWDRFFTMPYTTFSGKSMKYNYSPPPFFAPKRMIQAEEQRLLDMTKTWETIINNCVKEKERLSKCTSESDCGAASVALQRCTAKVVCPTIAKEFDDCVSSKESDNKRISASFLAMEKCLELFEVESRQLSALNKKA